MTLLAFFLRPEVLPSVGSYGTSIEGIRSQSTIVKNKFYVDKGRAEIQPSITHWLLHIGLAVVSAMRARLGPLLMGSVGL